MIKIGIDPGPSSGGMATLTIDNSADQDYSWAIYPFKKYDYYAISNVLAAIHDSSRRYHFSARCVIEKVGSFPGSGKSSNVKLVENYGILKGILIANKISFVEATAKKWQKVLPVKRLKTDEYYYWKKKLVQLSRQLLPDLEFNNDMADAILMTFYLDKIFG